MQVNWGSLIKSLLSLIIFSHAAFVRLVTRAFVAAAASVTPVFVCTHCSNILHVKHLPLPTHLPPPPHSALPLRPSHSAPPPTHPPELTPPPVLLVPYRCRGPDVTFPFLRPPPSPSSPWPPPPPLGLPLSPKPLVARISIANDAVMAVTMSPAEVLLRSSRLTLACRREWPAADELVAYRVQLLSFRP